MGYNLLKFLELFRRNYASLHPRSGGPNGRQAERVESPRDDPAAGSGGPGTSTSSGTHLGRKFTEDTKEGSRKVKVVLAMRAKGIGYRKIAREVGLGW